MVQKACLRGVTGASLSVSLEKRGESLNGKRKGYLMHHVVLFLSVALHPPPSPCSFPFFPFHQAYIILYILGSLVRCSWSSWHGIGMAE